LKEHGFSRIANAGKSAALKGHGFSRAVISA
jgi:hypothetical protein